MQRILLIMTISFTIISTGIGQDEGVYIGQTQGQIADPSALLELDAINKGFLAPKVTLASTVDITTIASPAVGLLVFNTATTSTGSNDVQPGFYFWTGTIWEALDGIPSSASSAPCPDSFTDSRDGQVYYATQIMNQCWMATNLNYDVPGASGAVDTINPTPGYGRLYDWATIMNGATTSDANPSGVDGICPSGWHVPSSSEWLDFDYALWVSPDDQGVLAWYGSHGVLLKSETGWDSYQGVDGNGTNITGFNAFPAGAYHLGIFYNSNRATVFWSTTENGGNTSRIRTRNLHYSKDGVRRDNYEKIYLFPLRCLRDY